MSIMLFLCPDVLGVPGPGAATDTVDALLDAEPGVTFSWRSFCKRAWRKLALIDVKVKDMCMNI